jgi:transposase
VNNHAYQIGPIEAKLRAEAAERRRRLMEAKPPAPRLMLVKHAEHATEAPQRLPVAFDHHMLAYRAQTSGIAYVLYECRERGLTIDDLRRSNRSHEMVMLRGEIAHNLSTRFGWSYPQIARHLNRDHSSIIGCEATYCSINHIPTRTKQPRRVVTPEQMEEIKRRITAGEGLSTVARSMGHCVSTIVRRSIESGWYVVNRRPGKKKMALPLDKIEQDYNAGMAFRAIAAKYRVSTRTISRAVADHGWARKAEAKRAGQA